MKKTNDTKAVRLDRFLADAGCGTRTEVKKLIRSGRVAVAGETENRPERKVDPGKDRVTVDGSEICLRGPVYLMMNKPAGVLSATEDRRQETVLDLLPPELREGVFPAGRLDIDTEGFLLLTDDGVLSHNLLSPRKHVAKTYHAVLDGPVGEKEIKKFREGLDIGDEKPTIPAELRIPAAEETFAPGQPEGFDAIVVLYEGRFHQVKRMFEAVGRTVIYLERLAMGDLKLDPELERGEYRPLSQEELAVLSGSRRRQDAEQAEADTEDRE